MGIFQKIYARVSFFPLFFQIRKIAKGLKAFTLSPRVTDDEIYFFRKPILPQKEPSPMLVKKLADTAQEEEEEEEEEGLLDANDFIPGLSGTLKLFR